MRSVHDYVEALRVGRPFAQANYGDGEWGCLLGNAGKNVNGEVYEPELAEGLRRTLLEPVPGMLFGTNPGRRLGPAADRFIADHGLKSLAWVDKEILSGANVRGELRPFLEALRKRDVVLVGPQHLMGLPGYVVGLHDFVLVPDATAWREADDTASVVAELLQARPDAVVLFCAGMASNLMIPTLWSRFPDATFLDLGATLDPYVGRFTRKGYRTPEFRLERKWRNLGFYDPRQYWPDRFELQGEHYVAGGGHQHEHERQVELVVPALRGMLGGMVSTETTLRVLDYGCGPGRFRDELERLGYAYDGFDLIPELGTVERIEAERYDAAVAIYVLQHIVEDEEYATALHDLHRGLKPGGRLLVIDAVIPTLPPVPGRNMHMAPRGAGPIEDVFRLGEHRLLDDGHWVGVFEK